MALAAFPSITPDKANYTVVPRQGAIIRAKLAGGLSASRLDQLVSAHLVNCTWSISSAQWDTLEQFFDVTLVDGSLPFTIPLFIRGILVTYNALFIEDSFGIQSYSGDTVVAQAQIEAIEP